MMDSDIIPSQRDDEQCGVSRVIAIRNRKAANQARFRAWWRSLLNITFDDSEQESPRYSGPNRIRANLPFPNTWLIAYIEKRNDGEQLGVFMSGRDPAISILVDILRSEKNAVLADLPSRSQFATFDRKKQKLDRFIISRPAADFSDEDAKRRWLAEMLNAYANVFRPRLKRLAAATPRS